MGSMSVNKDKRVDVAVAGVASTIKDSQARPW
jgi:hypothetical protein